MRAWRYDAFGPVGAMARLVETSQPRPGRGQVLVRVRYASINPLDRKLIEGEFKLLFKSKPPAGIGTEFSGVVEAIGSGVTALKIGTPVVSYIEPTKRPPGALQEHVAVDAATVVPVEATELPVACTLPVAGVSALQMCRLGGVKSGHRVLVHGAAGGVGSFAVQIVRALGARPVATGSRQSQELIAQLAPDAAIDYTSQRIDTWGGPFNVVLDCSSTLGGQDLGVLLGRGGSYVRTLPSFPSVAVDPLLNPLRPIKRYTLRLKPNADDLRTLVGWLRRGRLKPAVTANFAFANALQALELSHSGKARGKLVVQVA
jgi:NADPH:quinone reductase-like Zn-dependent oxidoreductase